MLPSEKVVSKGDPPFADKNEVILESLSEGVCHINASGKIAYANTSAARMLNQTKQELLGKYYSEAFFGKDKRSFSNDEVFCPIFFTLDSGETSHVNKDTFLRNDKTALHVEYMCVALAQGDDEGGIVISFQDIAERHEAEIALSEARDAAVDAARTKAAFLANMSHEIRTPLNGIVGTTELLLESDLSADQRHYAQMLRKSTDLLRHIVNDILDYSKIEAGRTRLEGVDFDISDLMAEIRDLFAPSADKKRLKLTVEIAEDIPSPLQADTNKIRQILNNLVNNAIKFTSSGSVSIGVAMGELEPDSDSVVLKFSVSDTGIGIEKEAQSKLFQPFEQADDSTTRLFGGTGLGLAISKKFVELLGGEIGVESDAGKGSTFWFTVEAKIADEAKSTQQPGQTAKALEEDVRDSDLRILVVEDNQINREVTIKMLQQMGLAAEWAENGLKSVDMVSENEFDLIFMDCQMPVMDGFEATRKIRQNPEKTGHPKIIALTASTAIEDSIKCLDAGMDDYLSKPFTKNDLTSVISGHFQLKGQSENLDFESEFLQHSLSDIVKPSTLENFREIESNGDKEFTKEILDLFAKHTEEQLDEIWVAFSKEDLDDLEKRAHNLKGSSANVGLETLQKRFEKLELMVRRKDLKAIEEQIRLAFIEFKETKQIILKL
ncbi:MAG: response regulator [Pyrinomonadaceae bacterium]|nr:response regulator [Pyrinomonadaceae bacterium]